MLDELHFLQLDTDADLKPSDFKQKQVEVKILQQLFDMCQAGHTDLVIFVMEMVVILIEVHHVSAKDEIVSAVRVIS